eukprot:CAMPEP_0181470512 /NCGR_PEP_ID=MMETSP1110-20121109/38591_1 /TAXON_ID=174948 /ORGANISM="Symbiodinium sp., Strain CCMP421" /LENGTH=33 /DNA_ID= /DNA_START= /DNA_END= /DNA_ORIENTATION=
MELVYTDVAYLAIPLNFKQLRLVPPGGQCDSSK